MLPDQLGSCTRDNGPNTMRCYFYNCTVFAFSILSLSLPTLQLSLLYTAPLLLLLSLLLPLTAALIVLMIIVVSAATNCGFTCHCHACHLFLSQSHHCHSYYCHKTCWHHHFNSPICCWCPLLQTLLIHLLIKLLLHLVPTMLLPLPTATSTVDAATNYIIRVTSTATTTVTYCYHNPDCCHCWLFPLLCTYVQYLLLPALLPSAIVTHCL